MNHFYRWSLQRVTFVSSSHVNHNCSCVITEAVFFVTCELSDGWLIKWTSPSSLMVHRPLGQSSELQVRFCSVSVGSVGCSLKPEPPWRRSGATLLIGKSSCWLPAEVIHWTDLKFFVWLIYIIYKLKHINREGIQLYFIVFYLFIFPYLFVSWCLLSKIPSAPEKHIVSGSSQDLQVT